MAFLEYQNKRKLVLGVLAFNALSTITMFGISDSLKGITGYELFGGLTVGSILGILSVYFVYQIFNRKLG